MAYTCTCCNPCYGSIRNTLSKEFKDDALLLSIKFKTIDIGFEIDNVSKLVEANCPPAVAAKKVTKTYERIIRRLFVK